MQPLEIFYGWVFFLFASLGVLISFERFSDELAARVIATPFKVGNDRHELLYRNRCVGAIKTDISPENHLLTFHVNLKITNGATILPISAAITCNTNQLEQMTNCGLLLTSGLQFIAQIKLTGPAPIKVDIASAAKLPISKITLPGPIELSTINGFLQIRGLSSSGDFTKSQVIALSRTECSAYEAIDVSEFTKIAPGINISEMSRRLEQSK